MDNLWQRRSTGKHNNSQSSKDEYRNGSSRTYQPAKKFDSHGSKSGQPGGIAPLTTTTSSNTAPGAASAFGLGSGAFASFGSSIRTPKTAVGIVTEAPAPSTPSARSSMKRDTGEDAAKASTGLASQSKDMSGLSSSEHPLRSTWIVWYRPPTSRYQNYEKATIPLAFFSTAEAFWTVYGHLKRPSSLPSVSDYHIFKKGVRPVWEDEENKKGGKWIIRLKKGVADRYWEDLLLGIVGDQFAEAAEEVCGAVLSVRSGEDVLSIWTRIDGGRNIKIRETVKRLLALPVDTVIVWKSHDDSIAQRTAIEQARQDKNASGDHYRGSKRRDTITDDAQPEKH